MRAPLTEMGVVQSQVRSKLTAREAHVGCSEVTSSSRAGLPGLASPANHNALSHSKDSPEQWNWGGESFHAFWALRPVPAKLFSHSQAFSPKCFCVDAAPRAARREFTVDDNSR